MTTLYKIENFDIDNIISIDQKITDKRYLIFDLRSKDNSYQKSVNQILIQLNDLEIINKKDDIIYFDITNKTNIESKLIKIEEKILSILKRYLKQFNKKGTFEFNSIIKSNENDQKIISFNLLNDDYPINCFDKNKQKVQIEDLSTNTFYNIVIEIMYMYLDMVKGNIVIDSRLRMVVENRTIPKRTQILNIDLFINDNNNEHDNDFNINNIANVFDITKTEHFEDDEDDKINENELSESNSIDDSNDNDIINEHSETEDSNDDNFVHHSDILATESD